MARSSTTYTRKWNAGKTTVIRVPEKHADTLLNIAQLLDKSEGFQAREDGDTTLLEFYCPPKRIRYRLTKPVNVSSIPQRSPFRYPGGKTWLIPYIRSWLEAQSSKPKRLIEPFAGGAIVSLTAGFEGLAEHVVFSENDPRVAAVWKAILNGHSDNLAERILSFNLTEEHARSVLNRETADPSDQAFQTILRNRIQRGGIMAPGAGFIRTGEAGRGLNARWYPETLARRIREINQIRQRFEFIEGDAFELIRSYQHDVMCCFYIDPPYTIAAKRLYASWRVDHDLLFQEMARCKGDFLMSYDNTEEVVALAKKYAFQYRPIAMKNTHHAHMTELLIGRSLAWIDA